MGLFRRRENRANGEVSFDDALLQALLNGTKITKEIALQVPTVAGAVDLIANIIAETPIKLYKEADGTTVEILDDPRIKLLNDETGDTLNSNEFWHAMTRDYFLGKGGYAYINRKRGKITSLHYVDENHISIIKNNDPIFKHFNIMVNGETFRDYDFLKILRNTKDGAQGIPITNENTRIIETAYEALLFESYLTKKGGNKKGVLQSKKKLTQEALDSLKEAYRRLYASGNTSDNAIILNDGVEFKEVSSTSVEMQLNENKKTNAEEFAKLFHISTSVMSGNATEKEITAFARLAVVPLMITIQCALNKDLLLEKEKGLFYWAFDTKELLKGDMQSRFNAYKTALDANFMQIDEVRYAEDLEPLGLNWIKLGLQDVLYDPKTKLIYTPNTNQTSVMSENHPNMPLRDPSTATIMEPRARGNPYHDSRGRFTTGGGIRLAKKEHARVTSGILTDHPRLEADGTHRIYEYGNYQYEYSVNGPGEYIFYKRKKIK